MAFEDHFSNHAHIYARHRPRYPKALYAFLAKQTLESKLAWDCATGNGQAAVDLVVFFDQVVATDASAEQISQAAPHQKITYSVAPAEQSGLETASVDLITVAQALHWFELDTFYTEVKRVLKPDGILAVWQYNDTTIAPEIDSQLRCFISDTLKAYWPPKLQATRNGSLFQHFPLSTVPTPDYFMEAQWNLSSLLGYLNSFSAVRRFEQEHGHSPIEELVEPLRAAWGDEQTVRLVRWPLYIRVGRQSAERISRQTP